MREGERRRRRWVMLGSALLGSALLGSALVGVYIYVNRVEAGDKRVSSTLLGAGLRDATLGGADTLACAEGESSRQFTATSAAGARVQGTVCCGLTGIGKGCTVRWALMGKGQVTPR